MVVPVRPARRLGWALAGSAAAVVLVGTGFLLRDLVRADEGPVEAASVGAADRFGDLDLSTLRLAAVVEAGANERLRRTIKELQDRIAALEEEARFYRRLVAPSEAERGFRIEELTITRTPEPSRFGYNLLLTQIVDRHNWMEGAVAVEVVGERDGVAARLALDELAGEDGFAERFRFLYFQEFSGQLRLPEGFVARSVTVTASVDDATGTEIRESFDWVVEES